ncbi:unnamed protein product (macronuclear) [Paramecium tetraurelia]|uniref:COMM domain-containing protein n=1 Tax=Paramecium tetraurelia TaxID=5888 RepID=A0D8D9_PARTE|nr:uncharacterized protein GSPATT00039324001 [Paramecium tetraurelia]CAK79306.1 unnamed protein product [Paramecium tetraurelia]|eukprot:XP_001446703.1 hypothetical protein (macronuclear) [Paramecium tetraurelia strain d4-2]
MNIQETKNIPEEVAKGLGQLAKDPFTQQNFDKLSKCVFMNLAGEENNTKILDQLNSEPLTNELFNLILLFTVQCIKLQLMEIEISTNLYDYGFDQTIVDGYIKKFTQFKQFVNDPDNAIIAANFESKIGFNYLVDVDWQQEIVVSSKYANQSVLGNIQNLIAHQINRQQRQGYCVQINNQLGIMVKNIESSSDLKHLK